MKERNWSILELEAMLAGALAERDAWKLACADGVLGSSPCRSKDDMALTNADGGMWIVPKPVAAEIADLRAQLVQANEALYHGQLQSMADDARHDYLASQEAD